MPELSASRQTPFVQLGTGPLRLRSVSCEAAEPAVRFVLRGDEDVAVRAGRTFGVDLPRQPCRAARAGARAALWLGPDEWLLLAFEDAAGDKPGRFSRRLEAEIETGLASAPHSLVDVGHRQAALTVTGRDAATALNGACALDLSETAFPVGMCTRTLFAKAELVLWRTERDTFHLEVWRSFIGYVTGLLELTCRDAVSLARAR